MTVQEVPACLKRYGYRGCQPGRQAIAGAGWLLRTDDLFALHLGMASHHDYVEPYCEEARLVVGQPYGAAGWSQPSHSDGRITVHT